MEDFQSKYSGEQVEEYLDKIANDELINEVTGRIPTKVSELENDSGYLTEVPDVQIPIESADGTSLVLGANGNSVEARYDGGTLLTLATNVFVETQVLIGSRVAIGSKAPSAVYRIEIGTSLTSGEVLRIKGPVFISAQTGDKALTLGTNETVGLRIDWGASDRIVFTNASGKKGTIMLT